MIQDNHVFEQVDDLIDYCIDNKITFKLVGEELDIRADRSLLTKGLVNNLKKFKADIILWLKEKEQQTGQNNTDRSLKKRDLNSEMILSSNQLRLWLIDQIEPNSAQYNIGMTLALQGTLDQNSLTKTFRTILERHEVLRTVYSNKNGQVYPLVKTMSDYHYSFVDLSSLEVNEQFFQVNKMAEVEAQKPFNLAEDLMLRATLIQLTDEHFRLMITLHHIAADVWSIAQLTQELSVLYTAYVQQKSNPLPELALQYADYALWQQKYFTQTKREEHLKYWSEQLHSLPDVHNLPLDKPRPTVQSYEGGSHLQQLNNQLASRLSVFTQQHNISLFMVLHAAFSCLLNRYSGDQDIVLGTPIANREHPGLSELVGFFANTLVLRVKLASGMTFIELLQQCKTYLLGAYAHQEFPFEQLVDELKPQRNLSYSPLFQVMLILQNGEQKSLHLPELQLHDIPSKNNLAKFDLTLEVVENEAGLSLNWQYASDLFNPTTIITMSEHFERLLAGLITTPTQSIFAIDMLSEQQQRLLVDRNLLNQVPEQMTEQVCIQELFEQQAVQTPDAIAVVLGEQSLSYQQLNQQANQLATYLIERCHIQPDTLVGVFLERSIGMIVGILAILKAGGAYVPLDPNYPEARLQYMLEDTKLTTILSKVQYIDSLLAYHQSNAKQEIIPLDDELFLSQLSIYSTSNIDVSWLKLTPNNLAYVIYTSGSTGQPKGVLQTHKTISNLMQGLSTSTSVDGNLLPLRTLQYTTINFDVSIQEICTAWFTGGTLVLINEQQKQDISGLPLLLQQLSIERLFITPALLLWLTEYLIEHKQQLPALKEIISAGDTLTLPPALHDFFHNHKHCQLWNHYGPTETHVVTSYHVNTELLTSENKGCAIAIGQPIANIQAYVLNTNLCLNPDGVPGELYLGGTGLAKGYLQQEKLTADKFIDNPFYNLSQPNSSKTLYKTGDIVRWLPNGNLVFLGRVDQQIKIRGFRIELGEIEHVIVQQEQVNDVAVLVKKSTHGDNYLVAYVAVGEQLYGDINNDSNQSPYTDFIETLKRNTQQEVPEYMVPSIIALLPTLPLTANGKIDRKALSEVHITQQQTYVAPTSNTESVLCDIWQKLLKVKCIGITDNFFELGGHSILSIQLVSLVNQAGFSITTRQLFEHQTVQLLAKVIETESSINIVNLTDTNVDHTIVKLNEQSEYFTLSPAQYWFFDLNNKSPYQFNVGALHELNFTPDLAAMKKALAAVITRHEVLRARFKQVSTQWQQFIQPVSENIPFKEYDYSSLTAGEQNIAIEELVKLSQASLNFETGNTLQFSFIYLGDERPSRLLTVFHHLLLDGYALTILLEEFVSFYFAFKQQKAPILPHASTPYKHAIELLKNHANHIKTEEELVYWQYLPTDIISLPIDFHKINSTTFDQANNQGSVICIGPISLDKSETNCVLKMIPAKAKISSIAVVICAIASAVAKWTNNKELLIGIGQYGRDLNIEGLDLSRTLGWYAVPFPFYIDFNRCTNSLALLKLTEQKIGQVPHSGSNYSVLKYLNESEEVQKTLLEKSPAEIGLNFIAADNTTEHSFDDIISTPSDIDVSAYDIAPDNNNAYKLDFLIHTIDGRLSVKIKYSQNIYKRKTMNKLMQNCANELKLIAAMFM